MLEVSGGAVLRWSPGRALGTRSSRLLRCATWSPRNAMVHHGNHNRVRQRERGMTYRMCDLGLRATSKLRLS